MVPLLGDCLSSSPNKPLVSLGSSSSDPSKAASISSGSGSLEGVWDEDPNRSDERDGRRIDARERRDGVVGDEGEEGFGKGVYSDIVVTLQMAKR
jgi:hypothetical protein